MSILEVYQSFNKFNIAAKDAIENWSVICYCKLQFFNICPLFNEILNILRFNFMMKKELCDYADKETLEF